MKNLFILLSILGLAVIYVSCGGSGDSSSTSSTKVTINLGEVQSTSKEKGSLFKETTNIPSEVVSIRFTISAADMVTIQKVIDVAGRTSITETFEIPNGQNRHILVEALDAGGNVIYRGETTINLNGGYVTLRIVLESTVIIQYVDLQPVNARIENDATTLSFQINNNGNAAANDVLVYVLYSDGYYSTCESLTIPVVPPGSSVDQSINASYPVYMIYYYKIITDPTESISETDENNNIACEWDLDHCSAPPPMNCL